MSLTHRFDTDCLPVHGRVVLIVVLLVVVRHVGHSYSRLREASGVQLDLADSSFEVVASIDTADLS